MHGIKSREGRWSVSLCSCSEDTAHFRDGNVIIHVALDDLRHPGVAMQNVADSIDGSALYDFAPRKEGLVQSS